MSESHSRIILHLLQHKEYRGDKEESWFNSAKKMGRQTIFKTNTTKSNEFAKQCEIPTTKMDDIEFLMSALSTIDNDKLRKLIDSLSALQRIKNHPVAFFTKSGKPKSKNSRRSSEVKHSVMFFREFTKWDLLCKSSASG